MSPPRARRYRDGDRRIRESGETQSTWVVLGDRGRIAPRIVRGRRQLGSNSECAIIRFPCVCGAWQTTLLVPNPEFSTTVKSVARVGCQQDRLIVRGRLSPAAALLGIGGASPVTGPGSVDRIGERWQIRARSADRHHVTWCQDRSRVGVVRRVAEGRSGGVENRDRYRGLRSGARQIDVDMIEGPSPEVTQQPLIGGVLHARCWFAPAPTVALIVNRGRCAARGFVERDEREAGVAFIARDAREAPARRPLVHRTRPMNETLAGAETFADV